MKSQFHPLAGLVPLLFTSTVAAQSLRPTPSALEHRVSHDTAAHATAPHELHQTHAPHYRVHLHAHRVGPTVSSVHYEPIREIISYRALERNTVSVSPFIERERVPWKEHEHAHSAHYQLGVQVTVSPPPRQR